MALANAVSLSFLAAFGVPAYIYVRTGDVWFIWLISAILGTNLLVAGIKELTGGIAPIFRRPSGATGCDAFCMMGPVGGKPGFPSGHMTTATMLVAALWFRLRAPIVLWIGIPWIGAMAWARWVKQCHNMVQIMAGTVFGLVMAVGFTSITIS